MVKNYLSIQELENSLEVKKPNYSDNKQQWIKDSYKAIIDDYKEINDPELDKQQFIEEYYDDIYYRYDWR